MNEKDLPVDEEDEAAGPVAPPADARRALERRVTEHAKVGLPVLVILATAVAGATVSAAMAILVLAGGALVFVIALFWSSLRTLVGETPLSGADAYALGAPRAEEEQKRAVLRALKDLEFERSVGKISDEDYRELVAKYRTEAKRLLRLLDEEAQPRRRQVESLVAKRLRRAGFAADEDADAATGAEVAARVETKAPADDEGRRAACAACGTINDEDAVFCKKCGARQAAAVPHKRGEDAADETDDEADETDDDDVVKRSAPQGEP